MIFRLESFLMNPHLAPERNAMSINIIITGVTGMVGEGVLLAALERPDVASILILGRRPSGFAHPKVKELVHADLFDLSSVEEQLRGFDACFFCLGTTSVGKKEEEYRRTTYDLTMHVAATLARLTTAMTFCYVSGEGTDGTEQGRIAWARVKGKTENDLRRLPFKGAYSFRPGFIRPLPGQKNAYPFAKPLGALYPFLKRLLPGHLCTVEDLAAAMVGVTQRGYHTPVLGNREIDSFRGR